MLEYISAPETSKKWGVSERRVQKLCEENRIPGAFKFSRMWLIPTDAEKPKRYEDKKQITPYWYNMSALYFFKEVLSMAQINIGVQGVQTR